MDERQLEHLIRASGVIIGDTEAIVVGSQSIVPWLKKYHHHPILAGPYAVDGGGYHSHR